MSFIKMVTVPNIMPMWWYVLIRSPGVPVHADVVKRILASQPGGKQFSIHYHSNEFILIKPSLKTLIAIKTF